MDLVIALLPPCRALRVDSVEDGQYKFDDRVLFVEDSPWAGPPDLLVDSESSTLVGLTYYFLPRNFARLKQAALGWDLRAYRILSADSRECVLRYPDRFDEGSYLELTCCQDVRANQRLAQLDISEVTWLSERGYPHPAGVVIFDIDRLLRDYDLMTERCSCSLKA
jgi:hypothetical protein